MDEGPGLDGSASGAAGVTRYHHFPQAPRNRTVALSGPLRLPAVEPVSQLAVRSKVLEAHMRRAEPSSSASLAQLGARVASGIVPPQCDFPGLADELAPYIKERAPDDKDTAISKAQAEYAVYCRWRERSVRIDRLDNAAFSRLVLDIHNEFGEGGDDFRAGPVIIRPDNLGNKVVFPHHRECPALIQQLSCFLRAHVAPYPALCATAAYAAIIYAHPFTDGNGRTARTLWNLILSHGTQSRHFVPIYLIGLLDSGSFLIKLRRAIYGGDWLGLQSFFTDAGRISIALQASQTIGLGHGEYREEGVV
jgi:hypothetical protein